MFYSYSAIQELEVRRCRQGSQHRLEYNAAVVERLFVVFVSSESRWVDVFLELPILLKRAKFFRVNRAGSEVGRVVSARFVRGSASSSSLSSCRFRDGGCAGTCASWVGRSSAWESSGEGWFLSIVKNKRK
jgi:hypothetical protein